MKIKTQILIVFLLLCFPLFYASVFGMPVSADNSLTLKVGLYENNPKIFTDENGDAAGFWPDIMAYIAAEEGWEIEYVPGTWAESLDRLEKNEIDIMPDVAYTEERAELYDFSHETVYVSWSRVYTREEVDIESILDLEGKSIAVLQGSVNVEGPDGIKALVSRFDIDCSFIEVGSYLRVFELLASGEAEAAVVSKDFGNQHQAEFNVVPTAIIFQPSSLYFAFPQNSSLAPYLIWRIDSRVAELKADQDSIYYQSLAKWFGVELGEKAVIPDWLKWSLVAVGGLALLFAGGGLILRSQVSARTKELREEIGQRKRAEEELRESEAFQSGLLTNSPTPIDVIYPDGSIRYVNPALERLTGFSAEELIGQKAPYPYWPKERHQEIMKDFKKAMRRRGERVLELYQKKSGEKFWVEITSTPVKKDGKFQYLLSSWVDVTESKRAEEKLRDEAIRHRILIDESSDGIVILDAKGKVYEANRRFAEMLGYTPEEARKLHVWDWEFQYPREQVAEMIRTVDETGDHFETKHRRKDGTVFDVEISTNGAIYAEHKLVFCVCRDITARKQAEAALKESEEKYKTLVETTSDIIWEVDAEGRFTFISPKVKDLLGYEVDEVVGKKRTLDLIAKGQSQRWLKRFKELNAKREPFFGLEITHVHKDGRQVICEISGIPLFDSAGKFKGYVGINKDITERRKMQEQLVITDRLASVGELAAGIAHELNNPLTGVVGFSQLLMEKEMPEDIKEDVQVVYREAQRASQVVKNLLTFARKHAAAKERVNINEVINKVLELRAYEQNLENIKVETHYDSALPEVMADYFQLQQVFLNIIINAEYFMKEANHKGTLTITTEKVGNKIRASFADDGPGIAKENLGHLFDPFFTTKEVGRGTGLGLSICHGIVAEHSGRIYVESELGKGATFIVELPIGAAERKKGGAL